MKSSRHSVDTWDFTYEEKHKAPHRYESNRDPKDLVEPFPDENAFVEEENGNFYCCKWKLNETR